MCTQLTGSENHIQFFNMIVKLWADSKVQNQRLAVQTDLTSGAGKSGNLGV